MTAPYYPRLFFLSLASFFLVYLATALLVAVSTPRALKAARGLAPRTAARFLLTLRLIPCALAAFTALGLCVPSYLLFEPVQIEEQVGFACLLFAILGGVVCGRAMWRAVPALVGSLLFTRRCRRTGRETRISGEYPSAVVIGSGAPFLALTGLVRPRVVISEGIVQSLSNEELSMVLSHERAHRTSGDNLKRLCILLASGMLPLRDLERSWTRYAEYAADEVAVAGDNRRALALASALVRVARCGNIQPSPLATSFVGDPSDLSARVDRLFLPVPRHNAPTPGMRMALIAFGCLAVILLQPSTLRFVQSIFERLIQ